MLYWYSLQTERFSFHGQRQKDELLGNPPTSRVDKSDPRILFVHISFCFRFGGKYYKICEKNVICKTEKKYLKEVNKDELFRKIDSRN